MGLTQCYRENFGDSVQAAVLAQGPILLIVDANVICNGRSRYFQVAVGKEMVRPERFELPAFWFVARRSIQLSYGRTCLTTSGYEL